MISPHFAFPFRSFPFVVEKIDEFTLSGEPSPSPFLRFKVIGTDKGLRNAVRFYWNMKKLKFTVDGTVYTSYAAGLSDVPDATDDEKLMLPPPSRAGWMPYTLNGRSNMLTTLKGNPSDPAVHDSCSIQMVAHTPGVAVLVGFGGSLVFSKSADCYGLSMRKAGSPWGGGFNSARFGLNGTPMPNYYTEFVTCPMEILGTFEPQDLYLFYSSYNSADPAHPLPPPPPVVVKMEIEYWEYA